MRLAQSPQNPEIGIVQELVSLSVCEHQGKQPPPLAIQVGLGALMGSMPLEGGHIFSSTLSLLSVKIAHRKLYCMQWIK